MSQSLKNIFQKIKFWLLGSLKKIKIRHVKIKYSFYRRPLEVILVIKQLPNVLCLYGLRKLNLSLEDLQKTWKSNFIFKRPLIVLMSTKEPVEGHLSYERFFNAHPSVENLYKAFGLLKTNKKTLVYKKTSKRS